MLHFIYTTKFLNLVRLAAFIAAVAVGVVLTTGTAKAGSFSNDNAPGGRYDYSTPKSLNYESLNPAVGGDGYGSYQRRQEAQERMDDAYRSESLRQERQRQGGAASPSNPYNAPEAVITPNGTMLCTKGFNGSVYCN